MVASSRLRRLRPELANLLGSLLAALFLAGSAAVPLRAAELLQVRLDGLELPIDLKDLEAWSRDPGRPQGDLGAWLDLLSPSQRLVLLRLLRAPILRDRSMGQQLQIGRAHV